MNQDLFAVAMLLLTGAVILATGFVLGMSFGARAERKRIDDADRERILAESIPPLTPEEGEELTRETQKKLAEAFTPGISHRFRGPSFGPPRLVVFHESDYEDTMMCAVGPKDTHELISGQRVYEIPVDTHDGQEGNVLLVCWIHGRPDEVLS